MAAMARFRLGQTEQAQHELKQAIESYDCSPRRLHKSDAREVWIYHILRREAEAMIFARR